MSPLAIQNAYVRALATQFGPAELVALIRAGNAGTFQVHGWVTEFVPADVAAGVQQGRRRAIILTSDVVASGFPLPFLVKQDRLMWGTKTNAITKVDDATRRVNSILVAFELDLEGA